MLILPLIKTHLMNGRVDKLFIVGHSMGAFIAGTVALQNISLFSKVALLCPALGNEGNDVDSYVKQTGALLPFAQYLFKIRSQFFLSPAIEAAASPVVLIQKVFPGKNGPQLFLSSGDQDQYGFYYGANVFVKYATVNGFQTIWKPVALGQHCSVDTDALAAFLL